MCSSGSRSRNEAEPKSKAAREAVSRVSHPRTRYILPKQGDQRFPHPGGKHLKQIM